MAHRCLRKVLAACVVVMGACLGPALADELEVTPWTVARFGGSGGDLLSIEKVSPTGAIILLNPHDETCTLRFPMSVGEKVYIRGATVGDQQAVCEVYLRSTTEAPSAVFTFECLNQTPSAERKCPPPR